MSRLCGPCLSLREWLRGPLPCFFLDTSSRPNPRNTSRRALALYSGLLLTDHYPPNCAEGCFNFKIATFGF